MAPRDDEWLSSLQGLTCAVVCIVASALLHFASRGRDVVRGRARREDGTSGGQGLQRVVGCAAARGSGGSLHLRRTRAFGALSLLALTGLPLAGAASPASFASALDSTGKDAISETRVHSSTRRLATTTETPLPALPPHITLTADPRRELRALYPFCLYVCGGCTDQVGTGRTGGCASCAAITKAAALSASLSSTCVFSPHAAARRAAVCGP